ncbi:MAG: hypothetical protein ABW122_15540, partial [Ilumatobacteraceae bacterium]
VARPVADDGQELTPADDDVHGHTVTVGRAVASDAGTDTAAHEPSSTSTRRVVLGTVAGVACLLAVGASLLLLGRGGDDESGATTTFGPTTTQLLEIRPPAPQGVTVAPGAEPGAVVVAWQAVGEPGDGTRYQVRPQTSDMSPQNTDQLALTIPDAASGGERPCFTVVAITPDGRSSEESSLECL